MKHIQKTYMYVETDLRLTVSRSPTTKCKKGDFEEKGENELKISGDNFLLLVAFVAWLCCFLSPATKFVARNSIFCCRKLLFVAEKLLIVARVAFCCLSF